MGIDLISITSMMEVLKTEGAGNITQDIQAAMEEACTNLEFFCGVGFNLGKVAKSNASEMTKARAAKMRDEISKLCGMTFNEPD